MSHATQPHPHIAFLSASAPLPMPAQLALAVAVLMTKWSQRRRTRQHLAELDDHMLKDIGISRDDARRESTLPFWLP
ncbi:DUF1127 domain-containing protein [Epibacterium sp. SM1969]|uniref:DUF1127 domain-containing protein n=1 Tax=Tritonibacter aquimaris TaxID=2663379 RepID=A0A844AK52_9RHOB|nr:DUF1127 domain-containing protein [Tritonibacter aquimaris]MQY41359.1 DUF1127 domain-containing protein [Tritonibacter aquimaris]